MKDLETSLCQISNHLFMTSMEHHRSISKKIRLKRVDKQPSAYDSSEDLKRRLQKLRLEQDYKHPCIYDSTMENQISLLNKLRLELVVTSTTPDMVLHALCSPYFSPTTYKIEEDNEPLEIFLACMKFMIYEDT